MAQLNYTNILSWHSGKLHICALGVQWKATHLCSHGTTLHTKSPISGRLTDDAAISGRRIDHTAISGRLIDDAAISGRLTDDAAISGRLIDHTAISGRLIDHTAISGANGCGCRH